MAENNQKKVLAFDIQPPYTPSCMAKKKPDQLTMRPSTTDWKLIDELKAKTGLNQATILRLALRSLAKSEGLKVAS